jgi:hypothetical protein
MSQTTKRKPIQPENEPIHAEYTFNPETQQQRCNHCPYETKTHTANMESHLSRKHKDIYKNVLELKQNILSKNSEARPSKLARISLNYSIEEFRKNIVEMVTINGRPLNSLEDSGFQNIIKPILEAFSPTERITVSRRTAVPWIHKEAEKLRADIKLMVKDKMISMKIDLATRLGRSIMGLNAQYVDDCRLKIITLAMKQVDEAHTAENLLVEFESILKTFGIPTGKIYRVTSDNGSNMIKMGQLLKNKANLNLVGCESDDESDDEDADSLCGSDTDTDSDDEDEDTVNEDSEESLQSLESFTDEDELEDVGSLFNRKCAKSDSLIDILRCFEHSLQLAPAELFKKHKGIKRLISLAKKASKKLRNQTFVRLLKAAKLKCAIFCNKTRWGTTFLMLQRLISLKTFCDENSKVDKALKIASSDWKKFEKLLEILEPSYESTIYYQRAQLTLSEAYAQWFRMELTIEGLHNNEFSASFLTVLKKHSHKIMDDSCVLAGVFLDPRYHQSFR